MGSLRDSLFAPVEREVALVEESIRAVANVDYPWLAELLDYVMTSGGKRVRPTLTLLAGKLGDSFNLDVLIPVATGVELLHAATLVHDDMIDHSPRRRGKPTVTNAWGMEIATLVGDYLFSKAAELVSQANSVRADKLFAQTLMALCIGELEELFTSFDLNQSRQSYFRKTGNKTGSLFSMATESAGIVTEAPEEAIQALRSYGHNLGVAFQIVDDILDFTATEEELGKPVAGDLLQGNLTLPAIMLRDNHPADNPIKAICENRERERNLDLALDMIRNSEIIPECYRIAQDFSTEARRALEMFPEGPCRRVLFDLSDYLVARQR